MHRPVSADEIERLWRLHGAEAPITRRANSWARSLSYAKSRLASVGALVCDHASTEPFVCWVFGASNEVEIALAGQGAFGDANRLDGASTEIVFFGDQLDDVGCNTDLNEARGLFLRSTGYEAVHWLRRPDMAAIFMPPVLEAQAPGPSCIPPAALEAVSEVPVLFTTRYQFPRDAMDDLRSMGDCLVLPQERCLFSSSGGDLAAPYADNGWLLAVRGEYTAAFVLELRVAAVTVAPAPAGSEKTPVLFWGILDLKFDETKPVLERVRVLETGDGRISKFSGHGAPIAKHAKESFEVMSGPVQRKYKGISTDKKMTHDLMVLAGYGHIVPRQACLPRRYDDGMAERIVRLLGLREGDYVVLKLCNRSRSAGVVVTPVSELDEVLEELLTPPAEVAKWLAQQLHVFESESSLDFGFEWGSFEEQRRHWWSNEHPCFVAEALCASAPTLREGSRFDGTMRVGFVLRRRALKGNSEPGAGGQSQESAAETAVAPPATTAGAPLPAPEELHVDWLGGYWKLPKCDMDSTRLRERVISAASTSGTAPVGLTQLYEVYAALGDSVQQLFGGREPNEAFFDTHYARQPEMAAYLQARLGGASREVGRARKLLHVAWSKAQGLEPCAKRCVESLVERYHGVVEVRKAGRTQEDWLAALPRFQTALAQSPTNANALYLIGTAMLELGDLKAAASCLSRSLLLDPDFKAAYVNLAVVFLQWRQFERALRASETCLARYRDTPMCHYHVGVACCRLALELEARASGGIRLTRDEAAACRAHRARADAALRAARASDEAAKRHATQTPWTAADDQMIQAMSSVDGSASAARRRFVDLPDQDAGWCVHIWRT